MDSESEDDGNSAAPHVSPDAREIMLCFHGLILLLIYRSASELAGQFSHTSLLRIWPAPQRQHDFLV